MGHIAGKSVRVKVPGEGGKSRECFLQGLLGFLFCWQFWRISAFIRGEVSFLIFEVLDCRLGPEGSRRPPGQSNMVPSNSDPST